MKKIVLVISFIALCTALCAENPFVGKWRIFDTWQGIAWRWEFASDMTGVSRTSDGEKWGFVYQVDEEGSIITIDDQSGGLPLKLQYIMAEETETWWGYLTRESDLYEIRGLLDYGREKRELDDFEEELVEALMETAFLIGVKE